MIPFARLLGLSSTQLECAAARVAEAARQRLVASGVLLEFAPARPAVLRGYARVHAAQAVRRAIGPESAGLSVSQAADLQRLSITRLTNSLMHRPPRVVTTAEKAAA